MAEYTKTMKLHIRPNKAEALELVRLAEVYRDGCNYVSKYVFGHEFCLTFLKLVNGTYADLRGDYKLKSQMAQSVAKTVIARYKTVKEQLEQKPYRFKDQDGRRQSVPRTLEWLRHPIVFSRPQADLVRGRDYSFVTDRTSGKKLLSLNTLNGRIRVSFDVPDCFEEYFDGSWSFGTGKIVSLNGKWYFHIPMTKTMPDVPDMEAPKHVVGIDRGLRFLASVYDEKGSTAFVSGKKIMAKRAAFQKTRSELQARGTKSAKRALKRLSGRENRWMSDVNHQISKTLVTKYGSGTLFVLEDLTGVSFSEDALSCRTKDGRQTLRTWSFYQLEQFLTYKAHETGSEVLKVSPRYTSQRCPKCGRIHKESRHHDTHEYICDACGYRSNDDRIGAMNIQFLGTLYVSGDDHPRFRVRKR